MVLSTAQSLFVPLHDTTINRLSNIITPFLITPTYSRKYKDAFIRTE